MNNSRSARGGPSGESAYWLCYRMTCIVLAGSRAREQPAKEGLYPLLSRKSIVTNGCSIEIPGIHSPNSPRPHCFLASICCSSSCLLMSRFVPVTDPEAPRSEQVSQSQLATLLCTAKGHVTESRSPEEARQVQPRCPGLAQTRWKRPSTTFICCAMNQGDLSLIARSLDTRESQWSEDLGRCKSTSFLTHLKSALPLQVIL